MFTDPLTDDDLYWIGYLRADGCMLHPRGPKQSGRICFEQNHREPVEAFRSYIGEDKCKVSAKLVRSGFAQGNIQYCFSSRKGYQELLTLGVKTKLREDIYKSRHFWRGLFDGDGGICLTTGNNGTTPAISITLTGRKEDLEKYFEFTDSLGITRNKLYAFGGCCKIMFGSFPAFKIIHHLYLNSYSALDYKRNLAKRALLWRPTRGITLERIQLLLASDELSTLPTKDQSQAQP